MFNKVNFRKQSLKKLKKLTNHYYLSKKAQIHLRETLEKTINQLPYKPRVLFYMPLHFEVDILSLALEYRKKCQCFIPFTDNINFKMVLLRYPFFKNHFGIKESFNSVFYKKSLDIMVVPIIGYDRLYRRIGFGKGMYDRFMTTLPKKPLTIFVQTQKQFSKEIITEHFDIVGDICIDAKGIAINRLLSQGKNYGTNYHNNYRKCLI